MSPNLSAHMTVIEEMKMLLKSRQTCITHISCNQNAISHVLANYARHSGRIAVWFPAKKKYSCLVKLWS